MTAKDVQGGIACCQSSSQFALPELSLNPVKSQYILRDEDCYALWDKYAMPENIRNHSKLVAHIAAILAELVLQRHIPLNPDDVRASALLHDLGKWYSLQYGGAHAQLGAAWVVAETRNYAVAQGVMHHVYWPWSIKEDSSVCSLPILVLYADKRARHDTCVTLDQRFEDLFVRYGRTEQSKENIRLSYKQCKAIEQALIHVLGWESLDAYTFDSRWLVNGA
ncbi:MAG: HDIG domain-containing protein [Desulfovibrio sp.]|nr:HDIG domain-containing protein [Desulfovibrio sp.]